jgi:hypothetical protein
MDISKWVLVLVAKAFGDAGWKAEEAVQAGCKLNVLLSIKSNN